MSQVQPEAKTWLSLATTLKGPSGVLTLTWWMLLSRRVMMLPSVGCDHVG